MAEETLDAAVKAHGLSAETCKTVGLMLEGAKGWTPTLYIRLVQDYGLENEVKTNSVCVSPAQLNVETSWSNHFYISVNDTTFEPSFFFLLPNC